MEQSNKRKKSLTVWGNLAAKAFFSAAWHGFCMVTIRDCSGVVLEKSFRNSPASETTVLRKHHERLKPCRQTICSG